MKNYGVLIKKCVLSACFLCEVKSTSSVLPTVKEILVTFNQFPTIFRSWLTCLLMDFVTIKI